MILRAKRIYFLLNATISVGEDVNYLIVHTTTQKSLQDQVKINPFSNWTCKGSLGKQNVIPYDNSWTGLLGYMQLS